MSGLVDTRDMYIALYNEETEVIEFPLAYEKGRRVLEEEKVKFGPFQSRHFGDRKGLTEWVIRHKEALLIEKDFDVWVEEQEDIEAFAIGTKCWLGAPMLFRDRAIGVIGLQNFEREGIFDKPHKDLLATLAGQAAIAIENARQYDLINNQLQRRIKELEAVSKFQQDISSLGLM
jgi:GAF domain-containing protein